jgi:hypothetical protein
MWYGPQNALPRSCYNDGLPSVARTEREILRSRMFSVDPQKTTLGIPLLESAASYEPDRRSIVIITTRNHLILRRVWWGKPTSGFVMQMVT